MPPRLPVVVIAGGSSSKYDIEVRYLFTDYSNLHVEGGCLRDAVAAVLAGAPVPIAETPQVGCGIKWVPGSAGSVEYVGKLIARGTRSDEQNATMLGYRGLVHLADRFKELTGQTLGEFRAALT
jgi:hypothetical protein